MLSNILTLQNKTLPFVQSLSILAYFLLMNFDNLIKSCFFFSRTFYCQFPKVSTPRGDNSSFLFYLTKVTIKRGETQKGEKNCIFSLSKEV